MAYEYYNPLESQKLLNRVNKLNAILAGNDNNSYNTVKEMQGDRTLVDGMRVKTLGYINKDDNGGAEYIISNTQKAWSITMDNGLFANIINEDSVNYRMFGAVMDGTNDDGEAIVKAHAYCNENKVELVNNFGILYKLNADEVEVKYDVNLHGTTILIDNENCNGWYRIVNDKDVYYSYEDDVDKSELVKDASYITMTDNSLPVNSVLHFKDNNAWSTRNDSVVWDSASSNIKYNGTWNILENSAYHGGSARYSETTGDYATFTFNGNGFEIYAHTSDWRGKCGIYVDDKLVSTIDCYSATNTYSKKIYSTTSLTMSDHTVKIVVTGEKNTSSQSTKIAIDKVVCINSYKEYRGELGFHTSWGNFTGSLTYGYDGDDTDLYFKYSKYNNKRLHFKGCNLRIETSPNITINFLTCTRHNTVIEDFVITPKNNATPNLQYHGAVLMIQDAYNCEFKNIVGAGIAGSPQYPDRKNSGYVLRLLRTFKTVISDCDIQGYWGVMGTACVKDLTVKDSTLNRIDIHNYFSEIFVQNVKLYDWGIDVGCGTGNLTFNNCKFINLNKPNWGGQTIVNINNTYGHLFDGSIIFRDCELVKGDITMSLVKVNWITGTGEPRAKVKFPNVIVDNLMIRNMVDTTTEVYAFRFNGTSEYASTTTKIERANFINLNNIYYINKDGSYGSMKLLRDESTTDTQFSTSLSTNITLSNIYSSESKLTSISSTNKFLSGCNIVLNNVHMKL